jgi:hypothetical protein
MFGPSLKRSLDGRFELQKITAAAQNTCKFVTRSTVCTPLPNYPKFYISEFGERVCSLAWIA